MFKSLSTIEFNAMGVRGENETTAQENLSSSMSQKGHIKHPEAMTSNFAQFMANYRENGCCEDDKKPFKRIESKESQQTSNLTTVSSKHMTRARHTQR